MNFNEQVYSLTKLIPKGKITTYKEIGRALKKKGQVYKAVGRALRNNPHAPKIPCHRVVCSDGSLGGYAGKLNSEKKIRLLEKEGIKIKNNRIVDFKKSLFRL